jgi:hypothetical protein
MLLRIALQLSAIPYFAVLLSKVVSSLGNCVGGVVLGV